MRNLTSSETWMILAEFIRRYPDCDVEDVHVEGGIIATWRHAAQLHYFHDATEDRRTAAELLQHISWSELIALCRKIGTGELEYLKFRGGLPASCKERLPKQPRHGFEAVREREAGVQRPLRGRI